VSPVCDDYAEKGQFPFTGTIDSVTFVFGKHPAPTGMDRLKMTTRMD
jgi:arylsulfatase